ncbi:MAG: hypothetical protein D6679_11555 [Candidatus Hydrogenedentota bacterium]|nr:MAG: hypothetical protein D6679_11555 [Candidatus Hydrogenedentota bacterium]
MFCRIWKKIDGRIFILLVLLIPIFCSCGSASDEISSRSVSKNFLDGPIQTPVKNQKPYHVKIDEMEWTLVPVYRYRLRGILVSSKSYGGLFSDWRGDLAPMDLAVVWGGLAKDRLYRRLSWSQANRWYYWSYGSDFPYDNRWIVKRSSNTHIIPANDEVLKRIKKIKPHQPVDLEGFLVKVQGRKGSKKYWWNSSTSRSDEGNGSCELMYVTAVKKITP